MGRRSARGDRARDRFGHARRLPRACPDSGGETSATGGSSRRGPTARRSSAGPGEVRAPPGAEGSVELEAEARQPLPGQPVEDLLVLVGGLVVERGGVGVAVLEQRVPCGVDVVDVVAVELLGLVLRGGVVGVEGSPAVLEEAACSASNSSSCRSTRSTKRPRTLLDYRRVAPPRPQLEPLPREDAPAVGHAPPRGDGAPGDRRRPRRRRAPGGAALGGEAARRLERDERVVGDDHAGAPRPARPPGDRRRPRALPLEPHGAGERAARQSALRARPPPARRPQPGPLARGLAPPRRPAPRLPFARGRGGRRAPGARQPARVERPRPGAVAEEIERAVAFLADAERCVLCGDFNVRRHPVPGFSAPIDGIDQILVRGVELERGPEAWPRSGGASGGAVLSDHAPVEAVIASTS